MKTKIVNYAKAACPVLVIKGVEEQRIEGEIAGAVRDLKAQTGKQFKSYVWSITMGLVDLDTKTAIPETHAVLDMLAAFEKLPNFSILVARDLHLFMTEQNPELPVIIRKIKDVIPGAKAGNKMLIPVGCQFRLPPELEKEITVTEAELPSREQLRDVLDGIASAAKIKLKEEEIESLLDALSGLTTQEAEQALSLSNAETRTLSPAVVSREKASTVRKSGVLELHEAKESLDGVGGLGVPKAWVSRRVRAFSKEARAEHLPMPKGILILGLPGTGKSLLAKVTANVFGVPLLKLDMGKVMGSLVGESERNIREALALAEAISPCVLFCDEIEKGISGSKSSGATDGGTTARVFGTILTWMQEKTKPVFVVATANDISKLPPELLRKGRFDELFFVDLPTEAERAEIFRIHITKKHRKPKDFDLEALAHAADGFTGAEIEAAFIDAMYSAFDESKAVRNEHVLAAIAATNPLSRTMAAEIQALRNWAIGRARRASEPEKVEVGKRGRSVL